MKIKIITREQIHSSKSMQLHLKTSQLFFFLIISFISFVVYI